MILDNSSKEMQMISLAGGKRRVYIVLSCLTESGQIDQVEGVFDDKQKSYDFKKKLENTGKYDLLQVQTWLTNPDYKVQSGGFVRDSGKIRAVC